MLKRILYQFIGVMFAGIVMITPVCAATPAIDAKFNSTYYADTYPDLKAAYGYDAQKLWEHYVAYGQYEKRKCYAGDPGGSIVASAAQTVSATPVATGYENIKLKDATPAQFNAVMTSLVNAYRAENGIAALTTSDNCIAVASLRVSELPTKFSHTRPNGKKPGSAFTELGIKYSRAGENLEKRPWAYDNPNGRNTDTTLQVYVSAIIDSYKASASHNACMLNPAWTKMGTAYLYNTEYFYNTQTFMQ